MRSAEPQRKADANPKNVLIVLEQAPCRNRKKKSLPAAVALVKNNLKLPAPVVIL